MPMYRLVDRHRAILEKIETREDAEYWGHMLIGQHYPDIPNSRSASGKLAALVGLTDYMDFYCAWGYYDLLKEGKTLEQARRILGERMARGIKQLTRLLGSKKRRSGEFRMRVGPKGQVVIPRVFREAFQIGPGTEVIVSLEAEKIVMRATRTDAADVFERIAKSDGKIRKPPPHAAYERERRRA